MLAHNPTKARQAGVPLKVAKEFNRADAGKPRGKSLLKAKKKPLKAGKRKARQRPG
jgi:hypothetical protein